MGAADSRPRDGIISAAEWFGFAVQRVPELHLESMSRLRNTNRALVFDTERMSLQTPRAFYRHDLPSLTIAKTPEHR
jgi:hypothetical protein